MPTLDALLDTQPYAPLVRVVAEVAAAQGVEAYAVGGAVRDLLLHRETTDLDFVSVGAGTGIALAKGVAARLGGSTAHVYPAFGTAAVRANLADGTPLDLEFVAARRESYRRGSRKPIVEDGTLDDDQRRRDFTVNALALDLRPGHFAELVDPFGGVADLNDGILRTPLEPAATFSDDPLRMTRAARFAAQLRFRIAPETWAGMQAEADRIGIVSQERVTQEMQKMIVTQVPSEGFRLLFEAGLLTHVFPELDALGGVDTVGGYAHKDNFYHTLGVLDNLAALTRDRAPEATRWLRWAALLHDIGKPRTKRFAKGTGWTFHGHEDLGARMVPDVFRRLKLPLGEPLRIVETLVRLHHRPVSLVDDAVTDSAVRRLLFDAGDLIDELMTLVRADITSRNARRVRKYLAAFDRVEDKFAEVEEKDRLREFQPPVDGREIMDALGIDAGLAVGILKDRIREAILDGAIPNEHGPAYAFMLTHRDDALRRGRLFDTMRERLEGRERRAFGAIKGAVVLDDLPEDDEAAIAYLDAVKTDALAETAR